jgi:hypothetical protein
MSLGNVFSALMKTYVSYLRTTGFELYAPEELQQLLQENEDL